MRIFITIFLFFMSCAFADRVTIAMYKTSGEGKTYIGTVVAKDTHFGLLLTPNLTDLPPGPHGFHIHEHPDCSDSGMAAGGHYDPGETNTHLGPYGQGHLGDLPVLIVDASGKATIPVVAPRLKVRDLLGHSLMIHAGSDTYSDTPPLGGGGARIACGIIE